METLNAAVIGVGSMGYNHARVYSELENANLIGVSDTSEERTSKVAKDFSTNGFVDYRQMLKDEKIDLVSIVVPTQYHTQVALDCIEQGIDILVEKPIADTVENGRKILDVAKEKDVKVLVGHIERFNPAVIKLKQLLEKGDLGKIFKIHSRREGPFPNRIRDMGVVIDLAVHDIDLMRYFTESDVQRVYAEAEQRIHEKHEDILNGIIKFKNDAVGVLSVNWLTPEKIREISILGEKGMFIVKYLSQELWFYENIEVQEKEYTYSDILMGVSEGDIKGVRIKKQEPLKNELKYFLNCVSTGDMGHLRGEDGLKALEVAQSLIQSTQSNQVVLL